MWKERIREDVERLMEGERQRAKEAVGGQSRREYGGGGEEGEGAYVNHSFTSSS